MPTGRKKRLTDKKITKTVTARLPVELVAELKRAAGQRGLTMTDEIIQRLTRRAPTTSSSYGEARNILMSLYVLRDMLSDKGGVSDTPPEVNELYQELRNLFVLLADRYDD
jgi:hypothetical protein